MQPENWKKIERIFNEALVLPREAQAAFVEETSDGEPDLCENVLRLLSQDSRENFFLDEPVFTLGSQLLIDSDEANLIEKGTFAGYHLLQIIGRGGMGVVYLAHDRQLNRRVALKLLPVSLDRDVQTIARFRQEARAASKVTHQNVAHIYDFGEYEDRFFLAMEYVPGRTLRELLKENKLDLQNVIDITLQIAAAIQAAHIAGVVHRDIKPENIVVLDDGQVKILDFGLAKIFPSKNTETLETSLETVPGLIMGTTAYMSPEQIRGYTADETTDLWSLGVCLYEMLTGERPFRGDTSGDIQAAILKDEPSFSVPRLPREFSQVLRSLLDKNSSNRCQSAQELIRRLKEIKLRPFSSAALDADDSFLTNPSIIQETSSDEIHRNLLAKKNGKQQIESFGKTGKKNRSLTIILGSFLSLMIIVSAIYFFFVFSNKSTSGNVPPNTPPVANSSISTNPEAEREYQRGIFIWNKRKAEEMPQALAHFQKAIELDPAFAAAYAGLAQAYMWDGNPNLTEKEKIAHMRSSVLRALALDPNSAEAHTINAVILGKEWNWAEEVKEFEKAIAANPNYPTVHHWYGETLAFLGRDDEAIKHINKALELDPLSFAILNDAMTINWYTGHYEEAIKKAERMIAFDKRYEWNARLWLSRLYFHVGDKERAKQEFKRYEQLKEKVSDSGYGNFYALIGEKERALFFLKRIENSNDSVKEAMTLAGSYAALGMQQEAFRWLEIAFENRNPSIIALAANPDFDSLRSDPHYWNLLERMNLAEYWKKEFIKIYSH